MLCSRQNKIGFLTFASFLFCEWVPIASADECLLAADVDGLLSIFDILDVGSTADIDALVCGTGASAEGEGAIAFGTNAATMVRQALRSVLELKRRVMVRRQSGQGLLRQD